MSGTGVRDVVNGGYVELDAIGLSASLVGDLRIWLQKYEEAHFAGFPGETVTKLDKEGLGLASRAQSEVSGRRFGYYSNGQIKRLV